METKIKVTIEAVINAGVEKVWKLWTGPEHIVKWNNASPDWHTTRAENDLRPGGTFLSRMEAKDGSFGFDFAGVYDDVKLHELISYTLGDERKVWVSFSAKGDQTFVSSVFEAETQNPVEMQKGGWQAILNSFKAYAEAN